MKTLAPPLDPPTIQLPLLTYKVNRTPSSLGVGFRPWMKIKSQSHEKGGSGSMIVLKWGRLWRSFMFLNSYIIKQKICKLDTYMRKLQTMSYTRLGCWNVALRVSIDNYVLQTCLSLVEEKRGLYITHICKFLTQNSEIGHQVDCDRLHCISSDPEFIDIVCTYNQHCKLREE